MTRTSRASPEYWRSDAEMGDHPAPREPHPGQDGGRSGNHRAMEPAHSARPGMSMRPIRAMLSLNGVIMRPPVRSRAFAGAPFVNPAQGVVRARGMLLWS